MAHAVNAFAVMTISYVTGYKPIVASKITKTVLILVNALVKLNFFKM